MDIRRKNRLKGHYSPYLFWVIKLSGKNSAMDVANKIDREQTAEMIKRFDEWMENLPFEAKPALPHIEIAKYSASKYSRFAKDVAVVFFINSDVLQAMKNMARELVKTDCPPVFLARLAESIDMAEKGLKSKGK